MNIEVTLLSKEEVEGKSKVLQKVGMSCGSQYWTSTPAYRLWHNYRYFYVRSSGKIDNLDVIAGYGVRPVLKSDNLDELIKDCTSKIENGIQIIEYGQFPNLSEQFNIAKPTLLKKTGKEYSFPPQNFLSSQFNILTCFEYDYNGQKVIENQGIYYPVKPFTWYIDRENNMLISTEVLFSSPIHIDPVDNKNYNGDFETSHLYKYLNNQFIKELKPEKIENLFDDEQAETANSYNLDLEDVGNKRLLKVLY